MNQINIRLGRRRASHHHSRGRGARMHRGGVPSGEAADDGEKRAVSGVGMVGEPIPQREGDMCPPHHPKPACRRRPPTTSPLTTIPPAMTPLTAWLQAPPLTSHLTASPPRQQALLPPCASPPVWTLPLPATLISPSPSKYTKEEATW
jgi:hypothetical protein